MSDYVYFILSLFCIFMTFNLDGRTFFLFKQISQCKNVKNKN